MSTLSTRSKEWRSKVVEIIWRWNERGYLNTKKNYHFESVTACKMVPKRWLHGDSKKNRNMLKNCFCCITSPPTTGHLDRLKPSDSYSSQTSQHCTEFMHLTSCTYKIPLDNTVMKQYKSSQFCLKTSILTFWQQCDFSQRFVDDFTHLPDLGGISWWWDGHLPQSYHSVICNKYNMISPPS